ncbi:hypothetical protein [Bdellovibrio sp.]|uniref:hypothetical protein n=1 Tax=Bdellovibrio TaxID=958 RepID=UPI00322150EA
MIKVAFLILLSAVIQGCSFAKNTTEANTIEAKGMSVSQGLSISQKNLLAAVKLGNLSLVEHALSKLQLAEYSFAGSAETPVGIALRANNLEVARFLVERAVDIYNLGDIQSSFEEDLLNDRNHKLMTQLGHVKIAQKMHINFSDTEQFLSEVYAKNVSEIVAKVESGEVRSLPAKVGLSGVSCLYLKTQLIQNVQFGEFSDMRKAIEFIERLPCGEKLKGSSLQALYQAELIRQFQRLFQDPYLLGYLSRQPQLKTTMWDIDSSGILVHPNLLFRIALSEDNLFLKEGQTHPCGRTGNGEDLDQELCDARLKIFNEAGIKASNFELIETRNDRIVRSYRKVNRHVRPMLAEADALYFVVSFYMSGKPDVANISVPFVQEIEVEKLGESIPWSLIRPSRAKPVVQMTDEYDEKEWFTKQEQLKRQREDSEIEEEKRANLASEESDGSQ